MALNFFEYQLFVLAAFCFCAVLLERYASSQKQISVASANREGSATEPLADSTIEHGHDSATERGTGWKVDQTGRASTLTRQYLVVYGIVMAADWMQGPYIYSLYREQYAFPESVVATLFVTGFLSAGVTAPLVGAWADQHGRKKVCQAFCLTYTLACACTLSPSLPVLFGGRVLGGISTSILYSAFESWLVSASNSQGLAPPELSSILGRATLLNGFVATTAGIVSNKLVGLYHNFTSPFIASGVLLLVSWWVIKTLWTENYGSSGGNTSVSDPLQLRRLGHAWNIVSRDTTLLTLGLTQTCFEGSMYLFVFMWVPSLQEAASAGARLPLGYIFSSFMVSMMLGSLLYTCILSYPPASSQQNLRGGDNSQTLHAKLSALLCSVGALALATSVASTDLRVRFWAFCLFEGCVGMYYPVQGMLRGVLIPNDHRATLSSLFRVPLNIFVVVSLMTGVSSARLYVFAGCAAALSLSAVMTSLIVVRRAEETPGARASRF